MDRLAASGCRFDNAFSTAPVCSPSRSTMVSGRYAWSIGTHHHRSNLKKPPRMFTHELRDAGYYVNWANKLDFNFEPSEDIADERKECAED
ncbi:arylsulfatase A-like enzyme [Puniceicoccus vermicola]|uniref:Sulfatase-like hydrolase/transferase n=1 Tax=Puniceicoccus vermicola TaxID=388746 RepID=A0A7X1B117_9BACT|nr:sulfatase-like hydrolase/transferase [Puniceicoccus vermicola]MBC2603655.1 sulfatase-like hydrolase/transferase [Puniceicoccus vermicola]